MPDLPPDLTARLIAFLRDDLGVEAPHLDVDTRLMSHGLVDSAGLMRLAAFVEDATGATIPDQDVTIAHFDTIRQILAYVAAAAR
ncbi:acyl carrier protein [bacterium]|nr:acyl carrier protein [bacterium]